MKICMYTCAYVRMCVSLPADNFCSIIIKWAPSSVSLTHALHFAVLCVCASVCVWVGDHVLGATAHQFSLFISLSPILITQRHSVCNAFLRMCKLTLPLPILFSYSSGLQRRSLPNPFAALQQQSGIKKAANTHTHRQDYKSPHPCTGFLHPVEGGDGLQPLTDF